MHRRVVALLAVAGAAAALLVVAATAQAHWPTIKADIVCDLETGALTVNYTSTAWPGRASCTPSRRGSATSTACSAASAPPA